MAAVMPKSSPSKIYHAVKDGKPNYDHTLQFDWITRNKGRLEALKVANSSRLVASGQTCIPLALANRQSLGGAKPAERYMFRDEDKGAFSRTTGREV